jgi:hypothetical protein
LLRVAFDGWSVEAGAAALEQRQIAFSAPYGGARFSWVTSLFGGCASLTSEDSWAACLDAELGRLVGEGYGVDVPTARRVLWASAVPNVVGRLMLVPNVALEVRLSLVLPATRPTFGLDGQGTLHRPAAVFPRGLVGVSWQ